MWELYLIATLGDVSFVSTIFAIFSIALTAILVVAKLTDSFEVETNNVLKKWIKRLLVISCISLVLAVFIPSKRDLYLMYGLGSTIDYIKDSDKVKKLPDKTVTLINQTLDKLIEEQKKVNNEQVILSNLE